MAGLLRLGGVLNEPVSYFTFLTMSTFPFHDINAEIYGISESIQIPEP